MNESIQLKSVTVKVAQKMNWLLSIDYLSI